MSSQPLSVPGGSYRAPALEHALVVDVMRPGVISCGPETDLTTVARTMAANHVHAVVVSGTEPISNGGEHLRWGIVTALDLVAAALPGVGALDAGALASTEIVTVDAGKPLQGAAQLMVEHQLTHLLVIDRARPVGILSTLDIAGCLASGEV
jgi:CBS domain-containing protein